MEEEQQHQFIHATLPSEHYDRENLEYELIVRQEPKQARMCGVGGKGSFPLHFILSASFTIASPASCHTEFAPLISRQLYDPSIP
ncbi:hypothetical protein BDW22DRAFT_333781 [Trametopsis cervina]|nr:hypothetical protein BDW22DRAFT_333781 [Trametopsis cervina]